MPGPPTGEAFSGLRLHAAWLGCGCALAWARGVAAPRVVAGRAVDRPGQAHFGRRRWPVRGWPLRLVGPQEGFLGLPGRICWLGGGVYPSDHPAGDVLSQPLSEERS